LRHLNLKTVVAWISLVCVGWLAWWAIHRVVAWLFKKWRGSAGGTNTAQAPINEVADDVANATKVAAAVAAVGAYVAAPTGLAALGAMFGVVQVPFIVRVAPLAAGIAAAAVAVSAAARLYAKVRLKRGL
jgi:hypothetical protein